MSGVLHCRNPGGLAGSSYFPAFAYGTGRTGAYIPTISPAHSEFVTGQPIFRPRAWGTSTQALRSVDISGAARGGASNTTRVTVDVGAATLTFLPLALNTTTAQSPRSIMGRLQARGAIAARKDQSTTTGGLLGPRGVGPSTQALANDVKFSNVAAQLGTGASNTTRKGARTSVAARLAGLQSNEVTVGNRAFTDIAAQTGPRGSNVTVGAAFIRRHVRDQIRDQYVAALKIAVPEVENRVYPARVYPLAKNEFPGIVVYTAGDSVIEQTLGEPQLLVRELQLAVQAYAKSADDLDGVLDDLATSIEAALSDDQLVSGLAKDSDLTDTTIEMVEGEQPLGAVTLTYRIVYCITESEPWLPL